jgi:hypothetical protein
MDQLLDVLEPVVADLETGLPETRWALYRHAFCEDRTGREPAARRRAQLLRDHAAQSGDSHLLAACDALIMSTLIGDPTVSVSEFDDLAEGVLRFEEPSDWWEPPGVLHMRAQHAWVRGDVEQAERLGKESLGLGIGTDPWNWTFALSQLALVVCELGRPEEAMEFLEAVPDELADHPNVRQSRAHTLIALGDSSAALAEIRLMVEAEQQPTLDSFCAAADYARSIGDHTAATWFLAKMLAGSPPAFGVHRRVIESATRELGSGFDAEWARGEKMDILSLHGVIREL